MLPLLRAFGLCSSQINEDRYAFGSVVQAVETAPGEGASVTGVHSLVYFTFSDDYPYACKCERHVAGSIVGYCKNDNNMPCYLLQDVIDGGAGLCVGWTLLSLVLVASWR
mmetsp:Transcript_11644/g.19695  ORF Transcript_11644/g.19695 Transcript_11644/m.19695 type:complete len:110 (+) Transcript_11644:77-406(+)